MTGVTATVLSTSDVAVSLSGIGIIAGAPIYVNSISVGSKTLNKKITKHEKTISIAEAKRLSVSRLFSKAIETNSISDIEFNSILHEIE